MKFSLIFFINISLLSSTLFSQNINSNIKQGISQYYYENSDDKWVIANKVVMNTQGQRVNGFYGWAAQTEVDYYFEGTLNGNLITGKKYSLSDGEESSFTINALTNSISISSPDGKVILSLDHDDLFAEYTIFTIYEQPDLNSRVINSEYDLYNKGFQLIALGKMEKDPNNVESSNIWYKIKNATIEGWIFGFVSLF